MDHSSGSTERAPNTYEILSAYRLDLLARIRSLVEQKVLMTDQFRNDSQGYEQAAAANSAEVNSLMDEVREVSSRIAALHGTQDNARSTESSQTEVSSVD